uniref:Metalloproteinase inhibitor n=1 Tax=Hemiscorpius lepturus TaxID=520031 RepID=A0A4P2UE68_HEMLE|nr:metalloproteinase inhibitor [Hemiscorpius lepturus]
MRGSSGILVRTLTVSFLLTLSMRLTRACSCQDETPQEKYCNAQFVALVEVLGIVRDEDFRLDYRIRVVEEFKVNDDDRHALYSGIVTTMGSRLSCYLALHTNSTYLIGGHISESIPSAIYCDLHVEWGKLSPEQRSTFNNMRCPAKV